MPKKAQFTHELVKETTIINLFVDYVNIFNLSKLILSRCLKNVCIFIIKKKNGGQIKYSLKELYSLDYRIAFVCNRIEARY
jgi:hypothetical protein